MLPTYVTRAVRLCWPVCLSIPLLLGVTSSGAHAQTPPKSSSRLAQAEKTAEALYLALLAEMQLQSEQPGTAYSLMLEAAKKSADPDTYKRAINIALQNRAGNAALDAVHAWVKAYPQSTEALRTLLQLQLTLQKIEPSGETLGQLLKNTPDQELPDLWIAVGQSYTKVQESTAAITVLERQLRPWLDKPEYGSDAWATLGRVQWAAKQKQSALASLQKALTYPVTHQTDVLGVFVTELLQTAPEQVQAVIEAYLSQSVADLGVRMSYVRYLLGKEKMPSALSELQILTAQHPRLPESWLLKGLVEHQLNQYPKAITSLKQFLTLVDADPELSKNLGRSLTQAFLLLAQMAESNKDFAQAEVWLSRIKEGDDVLSIQTRKASVLMKKGRTDAALALIESVPDKQDADRKTKVLTQIQLLKEHALLDRAYALLASETARQPDDLDLLYEQAMMADRLDRFQEMERLLRVILEKKPDYHHALNALGYALADRNERLPEAKELIEKALALAPEDPFITDSLGWVKFRLGRLDEAEGLLRKAFSKRADAEIAIHLAEVLWVQGRLNDAKSMFQQAKDLQADHPSLAPTMLRLGVQW